MSEQTKTAMIDLMKYTFPVLISTLVAFTMVQAQTAQHNLTLIDHENRIRAVEKETIIVFGDIKGDLSTLKARLTSIEKAISRKGAEQ